MLAAVAAARRGLSVLLAEQNEKLGKKLYITGKGRCNVTNMGDRDDFFAHVMRNPKFLYSALSAFNNQELCNLLSEAGCPVKVERGRRVFPQSDKSSHVLSALARLVGEAGAQVRLHTYVRGIQKTDAGFLVETPNETLQAENVLLACGGVSYPSTGSRGEGYRLAAALGHGLVPPQPSLVPLYSKEPWLPSCAGLTLKNVALQVAFRGKRIFAEQGELLLTHFGISGPLVLSASALITADMLPELSVHIDLKPALDPAVLDARLLRDLSQAGGKQIKNALSGLLPAALLPPVLRQAGVQPEQGAVLTREQRSRLAAALKGLKITVSALGIMEEAVITRGGIPVGEVNPRTMESRIAPGLYFAGEMLDVDALTGGYNLQIAFSTGWLAGSSMNIATI